MGYQSKKIITRTWSFDTGLITLASVGTIPVTVSAVLTQPAGTLRRVMCRRQTGPSGEYFRFRIYADSSLDEDHLVFDSESEGDNRIDISNNPSAFNSSLKTLWLQVASLTSGQTFRTRLFGDFNAI